MTKNIFPKIKKQGGYAILFTVIVISAISAIAAGLSSSAYKQLILSSLARDSQLAFYQSDMATDCALYADWVVSTKVETADLFKASGTWTCGNHILNIVPKEGDTNGSYDLTPKTPSSTDTKACFRISVTKVPRVENGVPVMDGTDQVIDTTILAKGYNICNINNPRTVEREIEINY